MCKFMSRSVAICFVFLFLPSIGRASEGDEHLVMGNPSDARVDKNSPNNYLIKRKQYALSFNNSTGTANWVSWHLNQTWRGNVYRRNPFAPDQSLPEGWLQIRPNDYRGSGFDRGHMCPSADRTATAADNEATFLMTNIVPQSPDNNQKTWEKLETYCRTLSARGNELYIVAGPVGRGGSGYEGFKASLPVSKGKLVVPEATWKVLFVLPSGVTDPRKVTREARVIAVVVPNIQGVMHDWRKYIVSVNEVEKRTGFTFFGNLPADVAKELKSREPDASATITQEHNRAPTTRSDEAALPAFEEGCIVANKRSRKYHLPGGRYYETGKKSGNAVFFKTAQDARKAGYEPAAR
jgi:endonuclease G